MKIKFASFVPFLLAGAVILFAIAFHILSRTLESSGNSLGTVLQQAEWWTYDARVKLGAALKDQADVAPNLAVLFFDDVAFRKINQGEIAATFPQATNENLDSLRFSWPWPRFIHGQIVRELAAEGAVAVGFDILFPELDNPDERTQIPNPPHGYLASDEFFAREMGRAQNVILAAQGDLSPAPMFLTNAESVASIASRSDRGVLRRVRAFDEVRVWHPMIRDLAKPLGLELHRSEVLDDRIRIPTRPLLNDPLPPVPFIIPLNQNGSMQLNSDGNIEENPSEKGPESEMPFTFKRVWNLGLLLAAKSLGLDLSKAEITPDAITLRSDNGQSRVIPVDKQGFFYVDWSIRFADLTKRETPVYTGHIDEVLLNDRFRAIQGEDDVPKPYYGRVVLIGSVATGNNVTDFGATPLEERTPLVTKHLNIANSLITGRFIQRSGLPLEVTVIALLGMASAMLTIRTRIIMALITISGLSVLYVFVMTWLYTSSRYWFPMATPLAGGLLFPTFVLLSWRVVFEQTEKKRVRGIFTKIVAPDVVTELLTKEKLALGGARREITVYFADVRGFTEFTDGAQAAAEEFVAKNKLSTAEAEAHIDSVAAETLRTVNLYLGTIAEIIKKHRGTLDKYIGDCVMAFWGAPMANEKHAIHCVRAAIDCQRALFRLNQERYSENERRKMENSIRVKSGAAPLPMLPLLALGSGINSGHAVVGLMGSEAAVANYTVFGREVNLASRLESISGRGRIIISEATYKQILRDDPGLAGTCIRLPATTLKGFREPVPMFEVPWLQSITNGAVSHGASDTDFSRRLEASAANAQATF